MTPSACFTGRAGRGYYIDVSGEPHYFDKMMSELKAFGLSSWRWRRKSAGFNGYRWLHGNPSAADGTGDEVIEGWDYKELYLSPLEELQDSTDQLLKVYQVRSFADCRLERRERKF